MTRDGNKVTVKIASQAPAYSLREFELQATRSPSSSPANLDKAEDLVARLRDSEVRHQLRGEPATPKSAPLQGRQAGCVLVLLYVDFATRCTWRMRTCADRASVSSHAPRRSTAAPSEDRGAQAPRLLFAVRFSPITVAPRGNLTFWTNTCRM